MKHGLISLLASAAAGSFVLAFGLAAAADTSRVVFPTGFENGVLYATAPRGNIRQELWTSREAISAAKAGNPLPDGTKITLVDTRDGTLFRYVVMEKRAGWGAAHAPAKRNGDWEFAAFNADRSPNPSENLDRCFACHKSQAGNDYVWTFERMKSAP